MKERTTKISNTIKDLEQEVIYGLSCEQLGSTINTNQSGYKEAMVVNHKAHAINMKVYTHLEVHIRKEFQFTRTLKTNIKEKMEAYKEYSNLHQLGF